MQIPRSWPARSVHCQFADSLRGSTLAMRAYLVQARLNFVATDQNCRLENST